MRHTISGTSNNNIRVVFSIVEIPKNRRRTQTAIVSHNRPAPASARRRGRIRFDNWGMDEQTGPAHRPFRRITHPDRISMSPQIPLLPTAFGLMASAPQAAHNSGYQLPPAALQALVDAPRAPALSLSPRRDLAALIQTQPLPGIVEVAQPELKLAGERINPRTCAASRFSFGTGLALLDVANGQEMAIRGLPRGLRLADLSWSPDQRHLAFSHVAFKGERAAVELWLIDIAVRKARRLSSQPLSAVLSRGFSWLPDSSGLLVQWRPAGIVKPPVWDGVPSGPIQQDSEPGGSIKQLRTYQDLLK